ncbi:hypothetical protein MAM1_1135d11476, partial [Mucor ambiguus]
ADVEYNLGQFGHLIDCGFVQGGSGCYGGDAYAVLAVGEHHAPLQHSLHWSYHPLDFSSPTAGLLPDRDHVMALATWAAMPPFCRYCHSMDHALINCDARKQKLTCDLCHEFGHYQRSCPRRNGDPDKSGKKRKVSQEHQKKVQSSSNSASPAANSQSSAAVPAVADPKAVDTATAATAKASADAQAFANPQLRTDPPAAATINTQVALDIQAALTTAPATTIAQPAASPAQTAVNASTVASHAQAAITSPTAAVPAQTVAIAHTHNTRSRASPKPQTVATTAHVTPICKHCNLPGHKMYTHNACLKNPKNLRQQLHQVDDVIMDQTASLVHPSAAYNRATDDASDSASMQD